MLELISTSHQMMAKLFSIFYGKIWNFTEAKLMSQHKPVSVPRSIKFFVCLAIALESSGIMEFHSIKNGFHFTSRNSSLDTDIA
jgi:hypothetical protein